MGKDATTTPDATVEPVASPRKKSRVRRVLTWVGIVFGAIILLAAVAFWYFVYVPTPDEPDLDATVSEHTITVDGLERTYLTVIPDSLPEDAPLWVAMHGSNMDGAGMRVATGYQLDELAVQEGFVAVYPTGYEKTWHGCRTETPYAARIDNIDDVNFLETLIDTLVAEHSLNDERVYGLGYSNGSNMAFRMAAESPGTFAGIEANAANYPAADNYGCDPLTDAIPTVLVEGTGDPINPYDGGEAGLAIAGQSLGNVMSAQESAEYIASVNGVDGEATEALVGGVEGEDGAVTSLTYGADSDVPVVLYTVEGGGHTVPNPVTRSPRMMGGDTDYLNAPLVAWELFESLA